MCVCVCVCVCVAYFRLGIKLRLFVAGNFGAILGQQFNHTKLLSHVRCKPLCCIYAKCKLLQ